MTTILTSTERWLLKPHVRLADPEKIQRSRLFSIISLVQMVVIALIIFMVLNADPEDIHEPTVQGAIVFVVLSIIFYLVNRFGYTSYAVLGYFLMFVTLFIYIPFYSGENPAFLAFQVVPLLFIAIFFSIKRTTLISIGFLVLVGVLLSVMDHSQGNLAYWNLRNMWYFLMLATALILVFMWHLGNLEAIRQQELKTVNEQLEQQVAELERFTYIVSHELKTPVVTIKGYLGSVEKDIQNKNNERARKDLTRISKATDKLHDTISDLLELSRVGHIVGQETEINSSRLIQDALNSMAAYIQSQHIVVNVEPDLPIIHGDRDRLREVFENLINNAVKYMGKQDNPVIEIGVRNHGNKPLFFVKDNGIGIEPAFHSKVFGLFEKLDSSVEGTGVGLALVKRIIETHRGKIWVESEGLGKGSTFCFIIPEQGEPDS